MIKEEASETEFAESIVNSVLEGDTEVAVDNEVGKGGQTQFTDGVSLIEAFKTLKAVKASTKDDKPKIEEQKWQIWYWKKGGNEWSTEWKENLQMKSSFTTRKEFWGAYNEVNGYEFGLLTRHFDYCVFKDGISPMWEDPNNRCGGRWILEFSRRTNWKHISYLDQIWLKVLLAITGTETDIYEYLDDICGCVLMIRYNSPNKIAIWTKNSNNTLVNLKIGELLKASTEFNDKMYYLSHDSSIKMIEVKAERREARHRTRRSKH